MTVLLHRPPLRTLALSLIALMGLMGLDARLAHADSGPLPGRSTGRENNQVSLVPGTGGHVPTWADEQRDVFHQLVKDNREARLHGDGIYQQAVAQQAALFAEAALEPGAGAEERHRAALATAMTLGTQDMKHQGVLLHTPAIEKARIQLGERMVTVSRAMVAHNDPSPELGLVNAAGYFASPSDETFNPALAAWLERQASAALHHRHASGQAADEGQAASLDNARMSDAVAVALERCAQPDGCVGHDRAVAEAFAASLRDDGDGADGGGIALARLIGLTQGPTGPAMVETRQAPAARPNVDALAEGSDRLF